MEKIKLFLATYKKPLIIVGALIIIFSAIKIVRDAKAK